MKDFPRPATLLECALAAVGLIFLLYADVLFQGASLAPLDYSPTLRLDSNPAPPQSLYPESANRTIADSLGDVGSAAWQMQPAIRFMAYCMRTGASHWASWVPPGSHKGKFRYWLQTLTFCLWISSVTAGALADWERFWRNNRRHLPV